jgi:hypothetical protein
LTHGLGCICSDGVSFPNKFLCEVLNQLNVNYETEKTFEWSDNKRYDIYIPDINCIIENHGIQHYEYAFDKLSDNARTLQEEQYNDILKQNMAIMNGVDYYIVLDCRKSETEWIKKSILNSQLSNIFDFSSINWDRCLEFASTNLIYEVARLWNDGNVRRQIQEKLKIGKQTALNYLHRATELGWCNYDPYLSRCNK